MSNDAFHRSTPYEFNRCTGYELQAGCAQAETRCGAATHVSKVVQKGFYIHGPGIICEPCRTIHITASIDGNVHFDRTDTWRRRPEWMLDTLQPIANGLFTQGAGDHRLISATATELKFWADLNTGTYLVTVQISDPITRDEIKAHLFLLYANFTWPEGAPLSIVRGGPTWGSILNVFGLIESGPISGQSAWVGASTQDFLQGTTLFFVGGVLGDIDGCQTYCGGGEEPRVEVPLGGQIILKTDLGISAGYMAGTNTSMFAEGVHAPEIAVFGRRWDSIYIMPPARCYYVGLIGSSSATDGCYPTLIPNPQYMTCAFIAQNIQNGTPTGFFAPLDETELIPPDHIVCARTVGPCTTNGFNEATHNPSLSTPGRNSQQFQFVCPSP